MTAAQPNKLIKETSPYLLQHAYNPVNWFPWGDEAFQKAKAEQKVVLVSIGYSACHWCHVMERESFEDEGTAAVMNDHFVNIKIDREERPDLDHIYMDAVQAMTGSGGWPLNVFLTPDAKPFYGGTYFPPQRAFNRASWTEVLLGVHQAWTDRRNEIEAQADNLTSHIAQSGNFSAVNVPAGNQVHIHTAANAREIFVGLMKNADTGWGGFGKAPKFPQTFSIQYLLQYYHYSKDAAALQHALVSIDKMLDGGIYDQVGGGLARYSTDVEWLAPHFEKMLYDNALLVSVLCDAFQITGSDRYRKAIEHILRFVLDELTHANGGFYAALDADSEGEEGKYYVWDKQEIEQLLGTDAPLFCAYYDVSEAGNWEGKNILRVLNPLSSFAAKNTLDAKAFEMQLIENLTVLKRARQARVKPGLDDKCILSWNALMIKAMAKAGVVLNNQLFIDAAIAAAQFIQHYFTGTSEAFSLPLFHTWKNDVAKYPGFLDDYAYLIDAWLQLYQLHFDTAWLTKAKLMCEYVLANFSDDEQLFFFYTSAGQTDVVVRKKEVYDGATPSANAVMAGNLLRLSVIFDMPEWRQRAVQMLEILAGAAIKYPASFGIWGALLLQQIAGVQEISVVGESAKATAHEILRSRFLPYAILMASTVADDQFPMLRQKITEIGTAIYLCHNFACQPPFYTVANFLESID